MNHNYFEVWSEEMAYYLGWLWADGNICDGKLQVGCCTEDEEILIGFMKAIGSTHAIQRKDGYWHKNGYYIKPYTKVSIYSKKLISSLIEKHCLLPRKTYIDPVLPEIQSQYIPHFVRGYYDGDGSIYKTKNKIGISIVGTQKFMEKFQSMIIQETKLPHKPIYKDKNTKTSTAAWYIGWNAKVEVLTFLNFIYQSSFSNLSRKKNLADTFRQDLENYCENCGIENNNDRIRLRFLNLRLGEYKTVEECKWARNYAHEKIKGYKYPTPTPNMEILKQNEISMLVERRLNGDKIHQRKIAT